MFRLKVARSTAEIEQLRPAWEALHSGDQSMFQSYLWNRLAAEVFAPREHPYFIFAESDSGAALVPTIIDALTRTISLAGERLFDYRDCLVQGDAQPLMRAWRHLADLNLPLCVTAVCRPETAPWNMLPKTRFSVAPRLANHGIFAEEFASRHCRAFSRLRKLERMGLRICDYSGESPVVRRIYECRAQQSQAGNLFADPLRVEFMVNVCREAGRACQVFTLEHGSTLAAALVTFLDGNFRRFYTTYYDHAWARYSPGVSLLFEATRRSLEQGLNFDMMTGEQAYKLRIASERQELFQVNATAAQLEEAFPDSLREAAA